MQRKRERKEEEEGVQPTVHTLMLLSSSIFSGFFGKKPVNYNESVARESSVFFSSSFSLSIIFWSFASRKWL